MIQAEVIRRAWEEGKINAEEYLRWKQEIMEPTGFWAKISWRLFEL